MSFEVRPPSYSPDHNRPPSEPEKGVLEKLWEKICRLFSFTDFDKTKVHSVGRDSFAPADAEQRVAFSDILRRTADFRLDPKQERRLETINREVPADILLIARDLAITLPAELEILDASVETNQDGQHLILKLFADKDVRTIVVDSEEFNITAVQEAFLPEIMREAFSLFGIQASVAE